MAFSTAGYPVRIRDRLGNDLNFEWDQSDHISRLTRRTVGSFTVEPIKSYVCDKAGNPVSVSELDAEDKAVRTARQVARIVRRARKELLQSVSVSYDGAGRPVSYTDQSGRTKQFERDSFRRIVKEIFPDSTEVAYAYDSVGRLESVLDENRNEIKFGWDSFGMGRSK